MALTRRNCKASSSVRSATRRRCGPLTTSSDLAPSRSQDLRREGEGSMRILALIGKRLLWFVPTAAGLIAVVFFISRVIPSDPAALLAGETASREAIETLRGKLGLDRPLLVQLFDYYGQLLRGDLGTSLFTTRPVAEDLLRRLPATIELTLAAMLIAILVGVPLGVVSATRRNSLLDHGLRVATVAGL